MSSSEPGTTIDDLPPPASREEGLRLARELGRRDAGALIAELRSEEQRQREIRLGGLAWRPAALGDDESAYRVVQLEERVRELGDYLRAIQSSTVWRTAQWFRRLFGRAW